jgi:hypothetical protein
VVKTLVVATVAMLLVPVGAEAAVDKLVSIIDQQNGVAANVSPEGALEVGDERGPLTVDGSVMVEPGSEPIMIDGAVEIDEESQPIGVSTVPNVPEGQWQEFLGPQTFDYLVPGSYVAITSVTVVNKEAFPVEFVFNERVKSASCNSTTEYFKVVVGPTSSESLSLPIPWVFQQPQTDCGSGLEPVTHHGFVSEATGLDGQQLPETWAMVIGHHG